LEALFAKTKYAIITLKEKKIIVPTDLEISASTKQKI